MATKTITLELDAYEKLRNAKKSDRESFSQVVRRARWDDVVSSGVAILGRLWALRTQHPEAFLPDDALDRIDQRARQRPVRPAAVTARGSRAR